MKARIIKYAVVFVFILLVFVLIKVSLTRLEDEIDENQVSTKGEISAGLDKEIKKEIESTEETTTKNKNKETTKETIKETTKETTKKQEIEEETTFPIEIDNENKEIDPNKPMIALTFDDGPNAPVTNRIVDALIANDAHATFFVLGLNIDEDETENIKALKRAYDAGCEIGNHTYGHVNLVNVTDDKQVINQVMAVKNRLQQITGQKDAIIRPPYGAADERVMSLVKDPIILWSVDSLDWKYKNPPQLLQYVKENAYDGAIILMHDIYSTTADGIIPAISWLKEQGYQLVTVSEMAEYRAGGYKEGVKYGEFLP